MVMKKIIAYIKGGIGNQLFCYAAARRLALSNNAELILDNKTWFDKDKKYNREYMLDHFHIRAREATKSERFNPFSLYWRVILKLGFARKFKRYLREDGLEFNERILYLKVSEKLYMDGYWQSEKYFKDIEEIIKEDFEIEAPKDLKNKDMSEKILNVPSIAIHMRWFDAPGRESYQNASIEYYKRAIEFMENKIESPHYFLFSENIDAARKKICLPSERVTCISHNIGDEMAYADLWLMSQCQHFIIANSTFSWWGAWLGKNKNKIVVTPDIKIKAETTWGFKGLVPDGWVKV